MLLGQGQHGAERKVGLERPHVSQQGETRGLGDRHDLLRLLGHIVWCSCEGLEKNHSKDVTGESYSIGRARGGATVRQRQKGSSKRGERR